MRELSDFKVGACLTLQRHCDAYRPIYYAAASGDFNPIHIDAEKGRAAGLGGAILQGLCTMAWAAEATARILGDPARIKKLHVRFSRPVKPGDTVTFRATLAQISGSRVIVELSAVNQSGEAVLKNGLAEGEIEGVGNGR